MKSRTLAIPIAMLALLLGPGCGDSQAGSQDPLQRMQDQIAGAVDTVRQTAAFQKVVETWHEIGKELEGIDTRAAAEAAKARLEQALQRLEQARGELGKVGTLAQGVLDKLGPLKDQALHFVRQKTAALRQNPQVAPVLEPVLARIEALLR